MSPRGTRFAESFQTISARPTHPHSGHSRFSGRTSLIRLAFCRLLLDITLPLSLQGTATARLAPYVQLCDANASSPSPDFPRVFLAALPFPHARLCRPQNDCGAHCRSDAAESGERASTVDSAFPLPRDSRPSSMPFRGAAPILKLNKGKEKKKKVTFRSMRAFGHVKKFGLPLTPLIPMSPEFVCVSCCGASSAVLYARISLPNASGGFATQKAKMRAGKMSTICHAADTRLRRGEH
jgi:hypothetical protein